MASQCKRTAIIIAGPGSKVGFRNAIAKSVTNIKNYLVSDTGGNWAEKEIHVLWDNELLSKAKAYKAITPGNCDYLYIHYLGHGARTATGKDILALTDNASESVLLDEIVKPKVRQCIIIDACRTFLTAPPSGLADQYISEGMQHQNRTRKRFDEFVLGSPIGQIIVQSTSPGTSAILDKNGPRFTESMLAAAQKFSANPAGSTGAEVFVISEMAKNEMIQKYESTQVPTYRQLSTKDLYCMFALAPVTTTPAPWS